MVCLSVIVSLYMKNLMVVHSYTCMAPLMRLIPVECAHAAERAVGVYSHFLHFGKSRP